MRVFLYRPLCGLRYHEDLEILRMRGYDAHCRCDVRNALGAGYTRVLEANVATRMMLDAVACMVIGDELAPDEVLDVVGWARLAGVPCYRLRDLPAMPPTNPGVLKDRDMRHERCNANDLTVEPGLRERLAHWMKKWMKRVMRWEARANAVIGGALKNPMARNAPKPYKLHTTVSRTG